MKSKDPFSKAERLATLTKLLEQIVASGKNRWIGRIHIQKACFFAQEIGGLPLGYDFSIYQYGPYSFEVDSDIQELVAIGAVSVETPGGYPDYMIGNGASALLKMASSSELKSYQPTVDSIANQIGSRSSRELELLATIYYVERYGNKEPVAERVHRLKPHFTIPQIEAAGLELKEMVSQVRAASA